MLVLGWEKGELGESWIGKHIQPLPGLEQSWALARDLTSGTRPGKGWRLVPT